MAGRLANKVALISGGARGAGAAHVELFAEEGADVVFGDILEADGNALEKELRGKGLNVTFRPLDVSQNDQWIAAVKYTVEKHGKLTTLVNNAAVICTAGTLDVTQQDWHRVMSINLEGSWLGMRAALPSLIQTGNGAIVNVCSLFSTMASPANIAYHASKGGVRIMTRSTALEFAAKGVRVNSVNPGSIDTLFGGPPNPELNAAVVAKIPLGRKATPREVAHASLFLASDDASYITATEIVVDGGWSAP